MKLEIDTTKKTICILEEAPLSQILEFLQNFDTENYKLISNHTTSLVEKKTLQNIPYIRPNYPIYPIQEYPPVLPFYDPYNPLSPIWVYDPNSQPLYQTT